MRLTCEVVSLLLMQAHLTTTGNKRTLVERLLQHEAGLQRGLRPIAATEEDDHDDRSQNESEAEHDQLPSGLDSKKDGSPSDSTALWIPG